MPKFFQPAWLVGLFLCILSPLSANASLSATDDAQHVVSLPSPALRIVSLAPHATELLFAAGAGNRIVGVSEYSDYPRQATHITSVGSATAPDWERIVSLKPDLVVAWRSGNSASLVVKLRELGIPVFESEPRDFETVASSLERLAHLAGTDTTGLSAAQAFRTRLKRITAEYGSHPTIRVFYQIWHDPLMTLNDEHLISSAVRLCGGTNVFGDLPQLTPVVDTEAVLKADPEVIISGSSAGEDGLRMWSKFPQLKAVKHENLFTIDSDLMTRPGPRILDGTEALCRRLDEARGRRK